MWGRQRDAGGKVGTVPLNKKLHGEKRGYWLCRNMIQNTSNAISEWQVKKSKQEVVLHMLHREKNVLPDIVAYTKTYLIGNNK